MFLIDDLLGMPAAGLLAVFEAIDERVNLEINDVGSLQQKLMDLQLRLEMEEISEAEYAQSEAALLALIDRARLLNEAR
ncbi:MAG: gas vesicle protein GvpG [Rhizobacter sp.]|nr:gas vesicle protein GvpG [Chlorobiales bacterium]